MQNESIREQTRVAESFEGCYVMLEIEHGQNKDEDEVEIEDEHT